MAAVECAILRDVFACPAAIRPLGPGSPATSVRTADDAWRRRGVCVVRRKEWWISAHPSPPAPARTGQCIGADRRDGAPRAGGRTARGTAPARVAEHDLYRRGRR